MEVGRYPVQDGLSIKYESVIARRSTVSRCERSSARRHRLVRIPLPRQRQTLRWLGVDAQQERMQAGHLGRVRQPGGVERVRRLPVFVDAVLVRRDDFDGVARASLAFRVAECSMVVALPVFWMRMVAVFPSVVSVSVTPACAV